MDEKIKIEETEDGSATLYLSEMDEHYHSTHGAIQEAMHVYIQTGLTRLFEKRADKEPAAVFEVGFGTGLNALLTLIACEEAQRAVVYHAIELHPLSNAITEQLNYAQTEQQQAFFKQLHAAPWDVEVPISDFFTVKKIKADLTTYRFEQKYDLFYFDAFAPDKQPDLWQEKIANSVSENCFTGGFLTTYCAKGVVRRMFEKSGFKMERLPGPPGKREILRGRKEG